MTDEDGKKTVFTARAPDGYKKINVQWLVSLEHVSVPVNPDTMELGASPTSGERAECHFSSQALPTPTAFRRQPSAPVWTISQTPVERRGGQSLGLQARRGTGAVP
jgi:hypothetical protein